MTHKPKIRNEAKCSGGGHVTMTLHRSACGPWRVDFRRVASSLGPPAVGLPEVSAFMWSHLITWWWASWASAQCVGSDWSCDLLPIIPLYRSVWFDSCRVSAAPPSETFAGCELWFWSEGYLGHKACKSHRDYSAPPPVCPLYSLLYCIISYLLWILSLFICFYHCH